MDLMHDWLVWYGTTLHHRSEYWWQLLNYWMQVAKREMLYSSCFKLQIPNYTNNLVTFFFFSQLSVWFWHWIRDFSWCGFAVLSTSLWVKTLSFFFFLFFFSFQPLSAHWSMWLSFNSSHQSFESWPSVFLPHELAQPKCMLPIQNDGERKEHNWLLKKTEHVAI